MPAPPGLGPIGVCDRGRATYIHRIADNGNSRKPRAKEDIKRGSGLRTVKRYDTTRWKHLLQEHSASLTSTVVPIPSRELREMLPPIRSRSSLHMFSPKPKPSELPFPL